jgi:hypothetical protein
MSNNLDLSDLKSENRSAKSEDISRYPYGVLIAA